MANERASAAIAVGLLLGSLILAMCAAPVPPPIAGKPPPLPTPVLLLPDRAGEQRLWGAAGLSPFFVALARTEDRLSPAPLRIVQIGDSHTAADAFSGQMREAFQTRYGRAGRGWLPAGVPFKYYNPRLVFVSEEGWRHEGPTSGAPPEALGLDALVAVNRGRPARMSLESTEPAGFDRLAIEYVAQPGGGDLAVVVDDNAPNSARDRGRHVPRRAQDGVDRRRRPQCRLVGGGRVADGADRLGCRARRPRRHLREPRHDRRPHIAPRPDQPGDGRLRTRRQPSGADRRRVRHQ